MGRMFFLWHGVFYFASISDYRNMKIVLAFLLLFFFSIFAQAQKGQQLSLDLNRSFHGTGDMQGLGFAVEYGHYLTQRLELTTGVAATVHHDVFPLRLTNFSEPVDASFRIVTAGLQWQGQVNYAPLRTKHHEARLGAGPVVRYQSSSLPNIYGRTTIPNYPEPVFTFRHSEKQNLLTLGYQVALSYAYTLRSRFFIGGKMSFQNDTNGDVITQYGLRIGKRF